jgi:hypothetical protein
MSSVYGQSDRALLNQERMIQTPYSIMVLSSFSDSDHITAYQEDGRFLWNFSFKTKILAWQMRQENGYLYVFSKNRFSDNKTVLTCIDPAAGYIMWEKP